MAKNLSSDAVTWDDVALWHQPHRVRRRRIVMAVVAVTVLLLGALPFIGTSAPTSVPLQASRQKRVKVAERRNLCQTLSTWADPRGVAVSDSLKKACAPTPGR